MSGLTMLTPYNLPGYLAGRGLLGRGSWTRHSCRVTEVRSRNRSWIVEFEDGRGFFCKQAATAREVDTLATEACVYQILTASLPSAAPDFLDFDPVDGILTVTAVGNARSLAVHFSRVTCLSLRLTRSIRASLAKLHSVLPADYPSAAHDLSSEPPWVLGVHRISAVDYPNYSAGSLQILAMIQQQGQACEALDKMRAGWHASELIHGDLKWENLIFVPRGRAGQSKVFIVDWEFACFGLRQWDLGCLIAEYFMWWAGSLHRIQKNQGDYTDVPASFAIESMTTSARELLDLDSHGAVTFEDLELLFSLAGARLIQRIVEQSQHQARITKHMLAALQLACNLLTHPSGAADLLLSTSHEIARRAANPGQS